MVGFLMTEMALIAEGNGVEGSLNLMGVFGIL